MKFSAWKTQRCFTFSGFVYALNTKPSLNVENVLFLITLFLER